MPPSSDPEGYDRRAGFVVVAAFGLLCVLFTGQFPPFGNPNELSRLDTIYAVVEEGTFRIDTALRVLGDHEDKARSGGHFYSNKAPGLALAAIPVYRLLRVFYPRPLTPFAPIFYWVRLLTVSSICVLALARFRARLERDALPASSLVAAAVAFGTPYVFYARSFFSHAWTAALLLLAWDLLRVREEWRFRRRVGVLSVAAGFLAGWAAISEYPVAVLAGLLAVRSAARGSWRQTALFAAGLAVPILVLLGYDAACFGSPFVLSSAREAAPEYASLSRTGIFGVGLPGATEAAGYLFHPARSILLFSPFFLWAPAGLWSWHRSNENRVDFWLSFTATLGFFLLMCGYPNWHGAWSLGNRYLIPVLFLSALAIPRALVRPFSRLLFCAAAVFAVSAHLVLASSFPYFPLGVGWSPLTAAVWLIEHRYAAPAVVSGTPAILGALVCVGIGLWLAGLPLGRRRESLAFALGVAPLVAILLFSPPVSYGQRLWRAAVLGKFSPWDPHRDELRAVVRSARSPREKTMAAETWRSYGLPARAP